MKGTNQMLHNQILGVLNRHKMTPTDIDINIAVNPRLLKDGTVEHVVIETRIVIQGFDNNPDRDSIDLPEYDFVHDGEEYKCVCLNRTSRHGQPMTIHCEYEQVKLDDLNGSVIVK